MDIERVLLDQTNWMSSSVFCFTEVTVGTSRGFGHGLVHIHGPLLSEFILLLITQTKYPSASNVFFTGGKCFELVSNLFVNVYVLQQFEKRRAV